MGSEYNSVQQGWLTCRLSKQRNYKCKSNDSNIFQEIPPRKVVYQISKSHGTLILQQEFKLHEKLLIHIFFLKITS